MFNYKKILDIPFIPFMNRIALKIEREFKNLGKHVSITALPSLYKGIRNETENYEKTQTAGIYKIS